MVADFLLVSDLDYTLLGDDPALARFADWCDAHRASLRLAYASSRSYPSITDSIQSTGLPMPDAVIADVGSDIRSYDDGAPIPGWRQEMTSRWDFRRVRAALARFEMLRLQEEAFQSEYKVTYLATRAVNPPVHAVCHALAEAGLSADVIHGANRELDVVPAGINKGTAAAFLARHWGFSADHVLVSGDSTNDLAMFQQDFRGIVVANGHPQLKALAGRNVYVSRFAFADGVLDGLRHWLGD